MNAQEAIACYRRMAELYQRQLQALAAAEPDLDALGRDAEAVDALCAGLPAPEALEGRDAASLAALCAAAREVDALHRRCASALSRVRTLLLAQAASERRGAHGAQAYVQATPVAESDVGTGRFIDRRS